MRELLKRGETSREENEEGCSRIKPRKTIQSPTGTSGKDLYPMTGLWRPAFAACGPRQFVFVRLWVLVHGFAVVSESFLDAVGSCKSAGHARSPWRSPSTCSSTGRSAAIRN